MTDQIYPSVTFLRLSAEGAEVMSKPQYAVYCLGNFDGVHMAHRQLLIEGINEKMRRSEAVPDCLCGAFIFTNPSCDYFPPLVGKPKKHLTSFDAKLKLFASIGLDFVAVCDFEEIRELSPDDFLKALYNDCACRAIVCGYNYSFGRLARGTPEFIENYFADNEDFTLTVIPRIELDGYDVSSTNIRRLITEGGMTEANSLLGYRYFIDTEVVKGKQLGGKMGFPTANQRFLVDSVIPAHGVYATLCHTPKGVYPGVSNVGVRPTVDGDVADVNCETHIIGFEGDLYGRRIKVEFIQKLRDEKKFANADELFATVAKDAATAEEIFKNL